MAENKHINWISILQGLSIILVVMNHVRLMDSSTGENYIFIDTLRQWFQPFFMELFFFASGFLLYKTRIQNNYSPGNFYQDKIRRLVVPYVFCTVLGNIAQIMFNGFVKHPHLVTWKSFAISFVSCDNTPWPHRWYLEALILMMVLYPFYTLIIRKKELMCGVIILIFMFFNVNTRQYSVTNWFCIFTLNKYLPFFLLGIITAKNDLCRFLTNIFVPVILWPMYFILFFFCDTTLLVLALIGVCAVVSTCIQLDSFIPSLFSSFRDCIFPIYLFGIAFQAFVELILWRRIGCPDNFVIPFYVLNVLVGIYTPVIISKIIDKIPSRSIHLCFGLR